MIIQTKIANRGFSEKNVLLVPVLNKILIWEKHIRGKLPEDSTKLSSAPAPLLNGRFNSQQRGNRKPKRNYSSTFSFFFNQVEFIRNRSPGNNLTIIECNTSMKREKGSSLIWRNTFHFIISLFFFFRGNEVLLAWEEDSVTFSFNDQRIVRCSNIIIYWKLDASPLNLLNFMHWCVSVLPNV